MADVVAVCCSPCFTVSLNVVDGTEAKLSKIHVIHSRLAEAHAPIGAAGSAISHASRCYQKVISRVNKIVSGLWKGAGNVTQGRVNSFQFKLQRANREWQSVHKRERDGNRDPSLGNSTERNQHDRPCGQSQLATAVSFRTRSVPRLHFLPVEATGALQLRIALTLALKLKGSCQPASVAAGFTSQAGLRLGCSARSQWSKSGERRASGQAEGSCKDSKECRPRSRTMGAESGGDRCGSRTHPQRYHAQFRDIASEQQESLVGAAYWK